VSRRLRVLVVSLELLILSTSLMLSILLVLLALSCRGYTTVMLSEVSDSLSGASSIVSEASMSPPEDVEDRRSY
jgi:hypothetical protein